MDDSLSFSILVAVLAVLLGLIYILKNLIFKDEAVPQNQQPPVRQRQVPQRVVGARQPRGRLVIEDDDEPNEPDDIDLNDSKMGAKKRAKLEAKAEKKAQREANEKMKEEKKKKQELEEEQRQMQAELEKLEEEKELAEEKRLKEEKEKRELDEYLKMKAMFSVEEEGFEEGQETDEQNLLQEFISYIKKNKVVVLEDLAAHFKLKTQNVIDRIHSLKADRTLSGVIDDRGKFIFISPEELEAVAKFVKQRGRVSIAELAESSNQLININVVANG